jgi:RNA polymerase sigma-70 factor (ECF subfamily)
LPAIRVAGDDVVPIVRANYHAGLGDDALIAGLVVADGAAATEFVRRFQAKVYGVALAVTREATLADDVAQEAFLRAWRSAATFDSRRGTVIAWLLTITRNAAIDAVRGRRSVPTDGEHLDALLHATLGGDVTAESATTHVDADRAVERLRRLPADQARAVALAVYGGCTAAEIAGREGVPLGTAKTRIRTGLRRLRAASAERRATMGSPDGVGDGT